MVDRALSKESGALVSKPTTLGCQLHAIDRYSFGLPGDCVAAPQLLGHPFTGRDLIEFLGRFDVNLEAVLFEIGRVGFATCAAWRRQPMDDDSFAICSAIFHFRTK